MTYLFYCLSPLLHYRPYVFTVYVILGHWRAEDVKITMTIQ